MNTLYILEEWYPLAQAWKAHHAIKPTSDLDQLTKEGTQLLMRIEKQNIQAFRDFRPNAYGASTVPLLRIVTSKRKFVQWINKPQGTKVS